MLRLIKKSMIATVAAMAFVATTLTGLVAGLIGAIARAQLPDPAMTEPAPHKANSLAPLVASKSRPPPALHQQAKQKGFR
jgi:hypothetical protein